MNIRNIFESIGQLEHKYDLTDRLVAVCFVACNRNLFDEDLLNENSLYDVSSELDAFSHTNVSFHGIQSIEKGSIYHGMMTDDLWDKPFQHQMAMILDKFSELNEL